MKFTSLAAAAVGALFIAGCYTSTPEKLTEQVHQWVPIGAPLKTAEHTMSFKGFDCTFISKTNRFSHFPSDILNCEKDSPELHDLEVNFIIENGKIARYGEITVDDIGVK